MSEPEKFQKPGAGYTTLVAWMCLSESGIFAIKELSRNTLLHCKKRELNPVYCDLERRCAPLKSALFQRVGSNVPPGGGQGERGADEELGQHQGQVERKGPLSEISDTVLSSSLLRSWSVFRLALEMAPGVKC